AECAAGELASSADAVPQQPDRPHELKAVATLQPLIEHHCHEDEAEHRRAKRQHHVQRVHSSPLPKDSTIATLTSFRNQPTRRSRSRSPPTCAAVTWSTLERTRPSNR